MLLANINPTFLLAGLVIVMLVCIYLLYLYLTSTNEINNIKAKMNGIIQHTREQDMITSGVLNHCDGLTNILRQNGLLQVPKIDETTSNLFDDDLLVQMNPTHVSEQNVQEMSDNNVDVNVENWHANVDNGEHDNIGAEEANDLLDSVLNDVSEMHVVSTTGEEPVASEEHVTEEERDNGELEDSLEFVDEEEEGENEESDVAGVKTDGQSLEYKIDMTKNKSRLNGLTVSQLRKGASERGIVLKGTNKMAIVAEIYDAL